VGVTAAALYPSFTLSGALSLSSLSIQNLITPAALAGNAAGAVTQTIFNRGKIREQIKVQDAVLDQQIATYESTVLTALKDVENALVAYDQEQARHRSLEAAAGSAGQALAMSRELYSAGLKTFLDVLESQRTLLSMQNSLAQSNANITADLVRLYKALGGGWN
jgi:outer membrane protein TolC